jgi:hypothetical protein
VLKKIDIHAWETEAWLYGTKTLLETIRGAADEAASREADELKRRAQSQGWDADQYFDEDEILDEKFLHWLPRVSTYSVIILLQSLVETQLHAYAPRLQQEHRLELGVNDLAGKGVSPAKKYIIRVARIDIENDPGWQKLADLQALRNIIVHQRGRQGESPFQQKAVQELLKKYPDDLSLTTSSFNGLSKGLDQELMTNFPCVFALSGGDRGLFSPLVQGGRIPGSRVEFMSQTPHVGFRGLLRPGVRAVVEWPDARLPCATPGAGAVRRDGSGGGVSTSTGSGSFTKRCLPWLGQSYR